MNKLAIVLIALGALSLAFSLHSLKCRKQPDTVSAAVRSAFTTWKTLHNKQYLTPAEELLRLITFAKNAEKVEAKNSQNLSYTLALNKFSDLTKEEFKAKYTGLNYEETTQEVDTTLLNDTPSNDVDWRTTPGVVTPVKDQGPCGSCWAFSATGALEGVAKLAGGVSYTFSEQQLVDCSWTYLNKGCNGGLMNNAFRYVIDHGITTEDQYPYHAVDQICKMKTGVYKITKFTNVVPRSSGALASAVDKQPISIGIEADEIVHYTGGIFSDTSCGTKIDHGVLLVGYTSKAWTVKNSWGADWGDQGYIYFSRTAVPDKSGGICGILLQASFPIN